MTARKPPNPVGDMEKDIHGIRTRLANTAHLCSRYQDERRKLEGASHDGAAQARHQLDADLRVLDETSARLAASLEEVEARLHTLRSAAST